MFRTSRVSKLLIVALVLALVASIPLVGGCKKGGISEGGALNDWFSEDPAGIDPQVDTTLMVYRLARDIFSTLLRYQGNTFNLEPDLLTEMPTSADGLTYHFKLRPDVKFHDGSTLTSSDVKFTMERMLLPATAAANGWAYEPIKGAVAMENGEATTLEGFNLISATEFELTLEQPFAPFLHYLAIPPASIYSAAACTAAGDTWRMNPVGTGPFKLAEYVPDTHIRLAKNADYYEEGLPYLDEVFIRIVPDDDTGRLEFENGTMDVSFLPTDVPEDMARYFEMRDEGTYKIEESTPANTYYFIFNESDRAVQKLEVRQAIAYAIDKQKLIDTIWGGTAVEAKNFISPPINGAYVEAPGYPFDLERAKALMAQAGVTSMNLQIAQRGGDTPSDTNVAIQAMLAEIGITAEIKIYDRATFGEIRGQGNLPCNYGNWWADYPDPDNYLYTYFHSSQSTSMSTNVNDPELDELLDQARAEPDLAKRWPMYSEAEKKIVYDNCWVVPLWHLKDYVVLQPTVGGWVMTPTGVYSYKTVYKAGR